MTVLEKAKFLESQIFLADSDINYSTKVAWGEDKDITIKNMLTLIQNTRVMFTSGRVEQLDYDTREETYQIYDKKLEDALMCFPDYRDYKEQEEVTHKNSR